MRSHRSSWIIGLTGVVLAGLVAGVQAASDLTGLVFLANRDSHELVVIDAATDQIISRVAVGKRPHMTVLSAAGKVYTTGTGTNDVTVVDAATLRVERKIPVQAKGPEHAALSPDGQFLWVANVAGNAVSVIDLAAAKTVQVLKGLSQPHNIVFAPDGKAYVTQVGSYRVAVFTPGQATPVARIAAGSPARLASLHPQKVQGVDNAALAQGLLFATNQDAGEVAVIDSARDAVVKVIPVGREPWEPYESPDHAKILVPNLADRTVSVIDVPSQKVLATLPGGKDMTGVVVTAGLEKSLRGAPGGSQSQRHRSGAAAGDRRDCRRALARGGHPNRRREDLCRQLGFGQRQRHRCRLRSRADDDHEGRQIPLGPGLVQWLPATATRPMSLLGLLLAGLLLGSPVWPASRVATAAVWGDGRGAGARDPPNGHRGPAPGSDDGVPQGLGPDDAYPWGGRPRLAPARPGAAPHPRPPGDGGGRLDAARDVAELFVPSGGLLYRERDGQGEREVRSRGPAWDRIPALLVLIDRGTASAAEVLAGALQQAALARLVAYPQCPGRARFTPADPQARGRVRWRATGEVRLPDGTPITGRGLRAGGALGIKPPAAPAWSSTKGVRRARRGRRRGTADD